VPGLLCGDLSVPQFFHQVLHRGLGLGPRRGRAVQQRAAAGVLEPFNKLLAALEHESRPADVDGKKYASSAAPMDRKAIAEQNRKLGRFRRVENFESRDMLEVIREQIAVHRAARTEDAWMMTVGMP